MTKPLLRVITPTEADDAAIMKRVAAGDLGALGALYDRYAAVLLRFLRRGSNREDAEDIVQVTFVRAMSAAGSFRSDAQSARPWLFGIALRVRLERRRGLRRFLAMTSAWGSQGARHVDPPSGSRGDVEAALASLTEAKRVVLLLAEMEGFTGEEIAETLGVPLGTVWTRLHNARREFREFIDGGRS